MNVQEITQESCEFKNIVLESNDDLIEYSKIICDDLRNHGVTNHNWRGIFRHLVNENVDNKKIELINRFLRFDERDNISIKIGTKVSILNLVISEIHSGDNMYLYGFVNPKTITKIYRDPSDNKLTQLEFNNDPYDVYPRKYRGVHKGKDIDHSIFLKNRDSAVEAVTLLKLSGVDAQGVSGI